jgi:hypothetical protein
MTTLTQAHNEWSKRAPDERFASLGAMYSAAVEAHENSAQADISTKDLTVDYSADGDIYLVGTSGKRANMTNWSMGQLARRAGVPNNYLANISDNPDLVAKNLNYGLQLVPADEAPTCNMLFRTGRPSGLQLRSLTSELYSRIWNSDVISSLIRLEAEGPWQPAPAAFDGSRGLYMGDRDMFAFMVDNERRIFEKGPGGGLSRGFFMGNSEVGAGSIFVKSFYYEYVCGNHRVWGASNVAELRIAHIHTDFDRAMSRLAVELKAYADSSGNEDEAAIQSMRRMEIGATKEETLAAVIRFATGLPQKTLALAYDTAEKQIDWYGAPNTVWGFAGGLTQIGRDAVNANERVAIDSAATKIMNLAIAA